MQPNSLNCWSSTKRVVQWWQLKPQTFSSRKSAFRNMSPHPAHHFDFLISPATWNISFLLPLCIFFEASLCLFNLQFLLTCQHLMSASAGSCCGHPLPTCYICKQVPLGYLPCLCTCIWEWFPINTCKTPLLSSVLFLSKTLPMNSSKSARLLVC